jgi:hypothetical protein
MYGAFEKGNSGPSSDDGLLSLLPVAGIGWTTTDLNVYADNGNYSVRPVDPSVDEGLLSRPDLKLTFTWAGMFKLTHSIAAKRQIDDGIRCSQQPYGLCSTDVALKTGGKCLKSPYTQTTPPYCNGPNQFWDKLLIVGSTGAGCQPQLNVVIQLEP